MCFVCVASVYKAGEERKSATDVLSNLDRYQRIAPFYDLLDLPFERRRYRALRPLLFRGLAGRLLDAGVGTGRNFPFYPAGVSAVVGIDLSPRMLARAERRRDQSPVPMDLRQMDVTKLDFAHNTFDAAVSTFLFCVLPDQLQVPALQELGRVVKPWTYPAPGICAPTRDIAADRIKDLGFLDMERALTAKPRRIFQRPDWRSTKAATLWMTSSS